MAYFRCSNGNSGGGQPTETVLWENASPSYYGETWLTLSDSVDNYDLIGVVYIYSTSQTSERTVYFGAGRINEAVVAYADYNGTGYIRRFNKMPVNRAELKVDYGYKYGTATQSGYYILPKKIIGLKF